MKTNIIGYLLHKRYSIFDFLALYAIMQASTYWCGWFLIAIAPAALLSVQIDEWVAKYRKDQDET